MTEDITRLSLPRSLAASSAATFALMFLRISVRKTPCSCFLTLSMAGPISLNASSIEKPLHTAGPVKSFSASTLSPSFRVIAFINDSHLEVTRLTPTEYMSSFFHLTLFRDPCRCDRISTSISCFARLLRKSGLHPSLPFWFGTFLQNEEQFFAKASRARPASSGLTSVLLPSTYLRAFFLKEETFFILLLSSSLVPGTGRCLIFSIPNGSAISVSSKE